MVRGAAAGDELLVDNLVAVVAAGRVEEAHAARAKMARIVEMGPISFMGVGWCRVVESISK